MEASNKVEGGVADTPSDADVQPGVAGIDEPRDDVRTDRNPTQGEDTATPSKYFNVSIPGTSYSGGAVVAADSKEDAANQFAASNGINENTFPKNEDGDAGISVCVQELDTVDIDFGKVTEILDPDSNK